jgi:glycosyltransferase involved in cell wall biosynthesis
VKKLLIITRWYLPAVKSGGTVRSVVALVNGLKKEFEITILTSNKDLGATEPYENIEFDTILKNNGVDIIYLSKINISNVYRYTKSIEPDIIYINSFFDITTQSIMFLKFFKLINQKIILAPRGELANGALSIKSSKKRVYISIVKFLNLFKGITFHATSQEEVENIKKIFPSNYIELIQNVKEENQNNFILPHKKKNQLKMVFISRIAPVKNLDFALNILKNIKIEGSLIFDIYGPDEDKEYWAECQKIIEYIPNNIAISYKGFVEPSMIKSTLAKYHIFFLPTKGENFGHAIVEAMQVGLIPLISNKTPWQNLENLNAGYSLPLNSPENFYRAIENILGFEDKEFQIESNNVKSYIDKKLDNHKTLKLYTTFFNQKKEI